MRQRQHIAFLFLATLLIAFVALFPVLAFDAVGKLFTRSALFQRGDFLLLVYLEVARALTTLLALSTAAYLIGGARHTPQARALVLFLIFAAYTYEKISAGNVYPGPFQQKLTFLLIEAGVSQKLLRWLFGTAPWSLWLALAALLRFSAIFPRSLHRDAIDASAATDRRGMFRGVTGAGFDIGALFRRLAKAGLRHEVYRPAVLWFSAIMLALLTTLLTERPRLILVTTIGGLAVSMVITNLRAAYLSADPAERALIRWGGRGFAAGAALFLLASLAGMLFNSPAIAVAALMVLTLAPAVVAACLVQSVLQLWPLRRRILS